MAVAGGKQAEGPSAGSVYASSDTPEPSGGRSMAGGVASGVELTLLKDNGVLLEPATAAFSLLEGLPLEYQSRDRVANEEILLSTTVLVDATKPLTEAEVVGASAMLQADRYRTHRVDEAERV